MRIALFSGRMGQDDSLLCLLGSSSSLSSLSSLFFFVFSCLRGSPTSPILSLSSQRHRGPHGFKNMKASLIREVERMKPEEAIIQQLRYLSDMKIQEVLDFILFLRERSKEADTENISLAQEHSMRLVWDNQEDEVWNDCPAW